MTVIKWTTLTKLNIDLTSTFPRLEIDALSAASDDFYIELTEAEKTTIDTIIEQCPQCKNKFPCRCLTEDDCEFLQHIDQAYQAFHLLKNTPFRQSRNAFGFTSSMIGLANAGLSMFTLSAVAAGCLIFLPALIFGGYVYYRGRSEEIEVNRDYETTLFDEKIKLMLLMQEKIKLKSEIETFENVHYVNLNIAALPRSNLTPTPSYEKVKNYKEKRGVLGNALSHCLVPFSASVGMLLSFFKVGLLAGLIGISGPAGWGVAMGVGLCVGSYFAYKRYKHLTYKKNLEMRFHVLEQNKKNLESENKTLKNNLNSLKRLSQQSPPFQHKHSSRCRQVSNFLRAPLLFFKSHCQAAPQPEENKLVSRPALRMKPTRGRVYE